MSYSFHYSLQYEFHFTINAVVVWHFSRCGTFLKMNHIVLSHQKKVARLT